MVRPLHPTEDNGQPYDMKAEEGFPTPHPPLDRRQAHVQPNMTLLLLRPAGCPNPSASIVTIQGAPEASVYSILVNQHSTYIHASPLAPSYLGSVSDHYTVSESNPGRSGAFRVRCPDVFSRP